MAGEWVFVGVSLAAPLSGGAKDVPPPKPSSPSSFSSASILKITSGADDPGFKLRYHHIALMKLRGEKEMNGTRIEALHETNIPASLWPHLSLPRGRLTTGPSPLRGEELQRRARFFAIAHRFPSPAMARVKTTGGGGFTTISRGVNLFTGFQLLYTTALRVEL